MRTNLVNQSMFGSGARIDENEAVSIQFAAGSNPLNFTVAVTLIPSPMLIPRLILTKIAWVPCPLTIRPPETDQRYPVASPPLMLATNRNFLLSFGTVTGPSTEIVAQKISNIRRIYGGSAPAGTIQNVVDSIGLLYPPYGLETTTRDSRCFFAMRSNAAFRNSNVL